MAFVVAAVGASIWWGHRTPDFSGPTTIEEQVAGVVSFVEPEGDAICVRTTPSAEVCGRLYSVPGRQVSLGERVTVSVLSVPLPPNARTGALLLVEIRN